MPLNKEPKLTPTEGQRLDGWNEKTLEELQILLKCIIMAQ